MNGAERVAVERKRQIEVEGWTSEHDDGHLGGTLVSAAIAYAKGSEIRMMFLGGPAPKHLRPPHDWPSRWEHADWKPSPAPGEIVTLDNVIRMRVKAAALLCADIDRLLRIKDRDMETRGARAKVEAEEEETKSDE